MPPQASFPVGGYSVWEREFGNCTHVASKTPWARSEGQLQQEISGWAQAITGPQGQSSTAYPFGVASASGPNPSISQVVEEEDVISPAVPSQSKRSQEVASASKSVSPDPLTTLGIKMSSASSRPESGEVQEKNEDVVVILSDDEKPDPGAVHLSSEEVAALLRNINDASRTSGVVVPSEPRDLLRALPSLMTELGTLRKRSSSLVQLKARVETAIRASAETLVNICGADVQAIMDIDHVATGVTSPVFGTDGASGPTQGGGAGERQGGDGERARGHVRDNAPPPLKRHRPGSE